MGVALILAIVTMASIHLARNEVAVLAGSENRLRAELLSQSAIEFAIGRIKADTNWRTNFTSGTEVPNGSWTSLGTGNVKFVLADADGNLADDDGDVVTLRGIGRQGDATQVTTVELEPSTTALDCLVACLHTGGILTLNGGTTTVDHSLSANANILVASGSVNGDAWSTGAIAGTVSGTRLQTQAPARKMPDTTTMWDYYLANGTVIPIASIPSQTITGVVLSSASNPYGSTNPQGIYIINTGGQTLHIRNSRIVGTLVVISPAAVTQVESLINWSPQASNYPALLVQGDLSMQWSGGSPLVESTASVNFNPTGTPFDGVADSDMTDSYPGIIKGLVYCSGNLSVTSACVMQGCLVAGGTGTVSSTLTIGYGAGPSTYPPPGFGRGAVMRVVPRTWTRVPQ
jgi:hypothetical protein